MRIWSKVYWLYADDELQLQTRYKEKNSKYADRFFFLLSYPVDKKKKKTKENFTLFYFNKKKYF